MGYYQHVYRSILSGILYVVALHVTIMFPAGRTSLVPREKCDCRKNAAALKYVLSEQEQKVVEVFARLPIAIQSSNKGASYPLIKLICEYSPWFLVSSRDFSQSWISQNGVDRPATGCDHVKGVALNYEWRAAGSGRICDLWYYLGGANIAFKRDDIEQLRAMTLLKNDAKEHACFEFESICGQYRNVYTQGVGFEQFSNLDVVSHIQACLKAQKDKEQKDSAQKEGNTCIIL